MLAGVLRVRVLVVVAVALGLVAACGGPGGPGERPPTPSPSATLEASIPAFQTFSAMTVPASAKEVRLSVVQDPSGVPAYRVDFVLPSGQVDAYCTAGQLGTPLDVSTVPPYLAQLFGYDAGGKDPGGVKIGDGGIPDRVTLQRTVLATGTDTSTATVRTYAYAQGR